MVTIHEIRFDDKICIDVLETAAQFDSYVHTWNISISTLIKFNPFWGHLTSIHLHSLYGTDMEQVASKGQENQMHKRTSLKWIMF